MSSTLPAIRETIREMNKVAIGRVVLTNREHIIALEPLDKGLMGTLLRYSYEVRSEEEYFDEIQDVKVTKDMLDLAKHIVNQKSGRFEPDKFEDRYETALVDRGARRVRRSLLTSCRSRGRLCRHRPGPCPCADRNTCHPSPCLRARSRRSSAYHAERRSSSPNHCFGRSGTGYRGPSRPRPRARPSRVHEHLGPVDLEGLAELDIGALDDLLQLRLALDQRQLPEVGAIEIELVEGHKVSQN
jgi:hypothetical protein